MGTVIGLCGAAIIVGLCVLADALGRRWVSGWDSRTGAERATRAGAVLGRSADEMVRGATRQGWRP